MDTARTNSSGDRFSITAPQADPGHLFVVRQSGEIRIIDLVTRTVSYVTGVDLVGVYQLPCSDFGRGRG